jgi:hypothetical protein
MTYQIVVQCLRCRHVGRVAESDLTRRGIKPNAPIASFVKRLRCVKCGSHSVCAKRLDVPRPTGCAPLPRPLSISRVRVDADGTMQCCTR